MHIWIYIYTYIYILEIIWMWGWTVSQCKPERARMVCVCVRLCVCVCVCVSVRLCVCVSTPQLAPLPPLLFALFSKFELEWRPSDSKCQTRWQQILPWVSFSTHVGSPASPHPRLVMLHSCRTSARWRCNTLESLMSVSQLSLLSTKMQDNVEQWFEECSYKAGKQLLNLQNQELPNNQIKGLTWPRRRLYLGPSSLLNQSHAAKIPGQTPGRWDPWSNEVQLDQGNHLRWREYGEICLEP